MSDPSLDRNCFLPLSEINLPSSYTLHRNSVNPCHDLVALHRSLTPAEISANQPHVPPFLRARMAQQAAKEKADSFLPSLVKGKQKQDNTEQKIRIGLWRAISGVHVWDVDVTANAILGMAWSLDGRYLSIVTRVSYIDHEEPGLRLVHLSVQDGSVCHTVPLAVEPTKVTGIDELDMEWCESGAEWPKDAEGSAGMIIDSIPQPNAVEHFEIPERNNPMAMYNKKKVTIKNAHEPHSLLETFPSVLDSHPPHVLCIPALSLSFLAGALSLTVKRSLLFRHKGFSSVLQNPLRREDLLLAQSANRARRYCDTIMKGLEACWRVWRKGIMEELNERLGDLERCASDTGVSRDAAMADLLRLLVAGRCGDAVGQLIGGKLTEGILTKWMTAYDDCVEYMHETLSYSIFPAVERLLLLLEELKGWSMYQSAYDLDLEGQTVEECIEWAKYLAIRVMDMDKDLADEAAKFREFGKWLKYEISRATVHDPDDLAESQVSKHDVASAAAYLDILTDNDSKVTKYFLVDTERLASKWTPPQLPVRNHIRPSLPVVLKELVTSLRGKSGSSSDLEFQIPDLPETAASFVEESTVGEMSFSTEQDRCSTRDSGEDPLWAIADVMLGKVENLLSHAVKESEKGLAPPAARHLSRTTDRLYATRTTENEFTYEVVNQQGSHHVYVRVSSPEASAPYVRTFRIPDSSRVANLDFFDDDVLVVVLQTNDGELGPALLYLVTVRLLDMCMMEGDTSQSFDSFGAAGSQPDFHTLPPLPISRSRRIGSARIDVDKSTTVSLSLNGRTGRRFACVGLPHGSSMIQGTPGDGEGTRHVIILDMDDNEGSDEDAGGEEAEQNEENVDGDASSGHSMEVD